MQNLRARAYDPTNGRFIGLDPFMGNMQDPQSLHKYAYVHGYPIGMTDPTGMFGLGGTIAAIGIAFSNVAAETITGAAILTTLQVAGKPAFDARTAGLILIANGDFEVGFEVYNVGSQVAALVLGTLETIDTAIGLAGLGLVMSLAAVKLAKHLPEIADALSSAGSSLSRKAQRTRPSTSLELSNSSRYNYPTEKSKIDAFNAELRDLKRKYTNAGGKVVDRRNEPKTRGNKPQFAAYETTPTTDTIVFYKDSDELSLYEELKHWEYHQTFLAEEALTRTQYFINRNAGLINENAYVAEQEYHVYISFLEHGFTTP